MEQRQRGRAWQGAGDGGGRQQHHHVRRRHRYFWNHLHVRLHGELGGTRHSRSRLLFLRLAPPLPPLLPGKPSLNRPIASTMPSFLLPPPPFSLVDNLVSLPYFLVTPLFTGLPPPSPPLLAASPLFTSRRPPGPPLLSVPFLCSLPFRLQPLPCLLSPPPFHHSLVDRLVSLPDFLAPPSSPPPAPRSSPHHTIGPRSSLCPRAAPIFPAISRTPRLYFRHPGPFLLTYHLPSIPSGNLHFNIIAVLILSRFCNLALSALLLFATIRIPGLGSLLLRRLAPLAPAT